MKCGHETLGIIISLSGFFACSFQCKMRAVVLLTFTYIIDYFSGQFSGIPTGRFKVIRGF